MGVFASMLGDIIKGKTPLSSYTPPKPVVDLTKLVKDEFSQGVDILNRSWEELNGYSVIERMNKDQRTFNSFVDESIEDPNEAWKWRGTRSIARNKALAMHAHLTARLAIPMAFAQNEKQEEDRDMSNIMRDILEWMAVNSEYKKSYILVTMGALVNPVTYLGADYLEIFQKVKERTEEGVTTKQVLDEELSGFRSPVYSADQILITNVYEQNIQRQRTVIKRTYKDYEDLKQKWQDHPNWTFVQKGIKTVYSEDDGLFYDVFDEAHPQLVEEAIAYSRTEDMEVPFLNGVYMGDDDVELNPIRHRDNRNTPKIPIIPFGFERINEHFFYYKSLMNRVGWDNALIDAMYENTMNRETLDIYTPIQISGVDQIDTQVVFPGSVVAFENPDAEAKPIIPPNRSGYRAMEKIEQSISESSISDVQTGDLPDPAQKAFSVARAEQNARTILKGTFRSIGESVAQYGQLMIDIALQHLTTAQLDEITGAEHYRPFILQEQMVDGKQVSKKILFDETLIGRSMTKKEVERESLRMLKDIGFPKNKEHIYRVNPHLWSKLKYLARIEPDVMIERNEAFERFVAERMYTLLRQDPLISAEALVRDILNANYHGGADERMAEQPIQQIMGAAQPAQELPKLPVGVKQETQQEIAGTLAGV